MSDGFDTDAPEHLATALTAVRGHGARITWFHPTREVPAAAALRGARAQIDRFIPPDQPAPTWPLPATPALITEGDTP